MVLTSMALVRRTAVVGAMLATLPFQVQAADRSPTAAQLLFMIQTQQKQLDALKAELVKAKGQADAASAIAEKAKQASSAANLINSVKIGGAIEVEATHGEDFAGADTSDFALATTALYFDANLADLVSTHVQILYEDDGNETITLDDAFVTLGNTEKYPFYLQAGRWAVPFGGFDTDMGSDPLTLDLGETKESSVLVGVAVNNITFEGYVYNGDTQKAGGDDEIDQMGIAVGYGVETTDGSVELGAGYIHNIADTNGLTDGLGAAASTLDQYVGGVEGHVAVGYQNMTIRGGYMTATKAFRAGELAFNGVGAEPKAWNLETAYASDLNGSDVTFAATVQGTDEALALGLPKLRYGAAVTLGILEHAAITAEYLHDEDYSVGDGGTGNNGHTATLKLAVEF